MKLKNLSHVLLSCSLSLAMFSCSNDPSYIVVSPDPITTPTNHKYVNKQINITVQDLRTNAHIVQIIQKDKAAVLINSQALLSDIITTSLTEQYRKQGLTFNSQATNQLEISLTKSMINVDQTTFAYQTNTEITLTAKLANGAQTLTKNLKINGKSNGPLSPDLAVLGRDFNQQLAKIIEQLINDPELSNMVK